LSGSGNRFGDRYTQYGFRAIVTLPKIVTFSSSHGLTNIVETSTSAADELESNELAGRSANSWQL